MKQKRNLISKRIQILKKIMIMKQDKVRLKIIFQNKIHIEPRIKQIEPIHLYLGNIIEKVPKILKKKI